MGTLRRKPKWLPEGLDQEVLDALSEAPDYMCSVFDEIIKYGENLADMLKSSGLAEDVVDAAVKDLDHMSNSTDHIRDRITEFRDATITLAWLTNSKIDELGDKVTEVAALEEKLREADADIEHYKKWDYIRNGSPR